MSRSLIAVALLLLAPLATAQQTIYKWTDAQGTVHYAQSAPPQGTKYTQMTLAGITQSSDADADAPAKPADDSSSTDTSTPAPPAPMADTPANRAKMCTMLKSNLTALQGSGPVVMQQGGKPSVLDVTQRKQQIDTANTQYQQYCAGQ